MKIIALFGLMLLLMSCSQKKIILTYEKKQSDKDVTTIIKNNNKKILEVKGVIIKNWSFMNTTKTEFIFESNYHEKSNHICEVWYVNGQKNKSIKLFSGESKVICTDPELSFLFVQDNDKKKKLGMPIIEVYKLPEMTLKYEKKFPEFENEPIGVNKVYYENGKFFYSLLNDFDGTELLEIDLAKL